MLTGNIMSATPVIGRKRKGKVRSWAFSILLSAPFIIGSERNVNFPLAFEYVWIASVANTIPNSYTWDFRFLCQSLVFLPVWLTCTELVEVVKEFRIFPLIIILMSDEFIAGLVCLSAVALT